MLMIENECFMSGKHHYSQCQYDILYSLVKKCKKNCSKKHRLNGFTSVAHRSIHRVYAPRRSNQHPDTSHALHSTSLKSMIMISKDWVTDAIHGGMSSPVHSRHYFRQSGNSYKSSDTMDKEDKWITRFRLSLTPPLANIVKGQPPIE